MPAENMRAAWFEIVWSRQEGHRRRRTTSSPTRPGRGAGSPKDQRRQSVGCKEARGLVSCFTGPGLVIPNSDGAGVIEAVGDGVEKSRIGERVWVYQAQYGRRFGTAAGYVALDASVPCDFPTTPASRLAHVWASR